MRFSAFSPYPTPLESSMTTLVLIAIGLLVCVVSAGLIAETLRIAPKAPERLYWAPQIPIRYVEVNGNRIRYIKTGSGPTLVLLHTLRTQLDIFEKLVPLLETSFTIYALDYPGHGFSDIPKADYRPQLFVNAVEGFLDKLDLTEVTLAGISIGGVIPLIIAANGDPRVTKVIAINPYDYGHGSGLARANAVAGLVFTLGRVPFVGEIVMRLRNAMLEKRILEGGVANPEALTPGFSTLAYASGLRPGHYQAFLNLIRHAHHWDEARQRYGAIQVPVLVVYGDQDWSRAEERHRTVEAIPGARVETVPAGGHFLSLDQPQRLAEIIKRFASA
jgi:pimeloyl-ACP methyl ester carboxylesterase